MALNKADKENLKTVIEAAKSGRLALLECINLHTGKETPVLVAVNPDGDEYEFVPMALFFREESPYDFLRPPAKDPKEACDA